MANVINYIFNISGNFASNIGIMVKHTEQLTKSVAEATGFMDKLGKSAMGFAAIADVAQNMNEAFSGIIEAGASAELQLMNLKTLFGGNAEAAKAMYERISEYGKVTPYDKAGLLDAQRTMMSFGMSGEAAFSTLQQIGDIAMGDSQKLQSLALAFAQMSSTGKLTGQDLMQMINAGFNPLNEISKVTGKSVGVLKEEMSKGAISADMVSEAFRIATSEGGLFYGAIEAASETTAGRMASIRDTIEEIKVSIFNALGDFGLWISTISEVMVPLSQVMPLLTGIWGWMSKIKGLQWASMWGRVRGAIAIMVGTMDVGNDISLGFAGNIGRATMSVVRFATVGIFQALKGLGALLLSFITTGGASTAFAATASISFGVFKRTAVSACRAVSVAIMNIPIIGWIAAIITGLIALFQYLWNNCEGFRAFLYGVWEVVTVTIGTLWTSIKDGALYVWGLIQPIFDKIWTWGQNLVNWVTSIPSYIWKAIVTAWNYVKGLLSSAYQWLSKSVFGPIIGFFTDLYSKYVKPVLDKIVSLMGKVFNPIIELWNKLTGSVVSTFKVGAEKGRQAFRKDQEEKKEGEGQGVDALPGVASPTGQTLTNLGTEAGGKSGGSIRNITISIDRLVEKFEVHSTTMREGATEVKEMIEQALLQALNDANLAVR